MATTENEYYIRAILLLVEGGSYISKKILYREHSGDLNKLLNSFKRELKHELHEKQIEKVFPPNGNTIVDTWDLQMLVIIVLKLFHKSLRRADRRNLRVLQLLRNDVQAHSPSATLDVVKYEDINDQLTDALTSLASNFEENVQEECRLYINKYASGPLDVMSSRECLKQLQNNDVLFQQVLENIEKSKNDICSSLTATQKSLSDNISQQMTDFEKNVIERLQRLEAGTCTKKIKVGTHVELSLGGPTEEWILLMERTLNDVFNEAKRTSGEEFQDIKKRVEELLENIKQKTTINFKGSKLKCIILMFECITYSGLLDLLQYLTSQKYQRRLSALAETLSTHFKVDIPVTATSTISPECLQNVLDDLAECEREKHKTESCHSHSSDEYKKSLKLAMECSSVEDLVYLWKMFQQGCAARYLDRIADTLSEYSGKKITLSSSIDLEEFKEALEDTVESATDANVETSKIAVESDKDADVETSKITVESVNDADVETSKITDSMKDVRLDQDEKDEAESLRPFKISSTTWMKNEDTTDEDKDDPFSPMMISRPARGRYLPLVPVYQVGEQYPNVHPGKMCPVCSIVHDLPLVPVYQGGEQYPNVHPGKMCPVCSIAHDEDTTDEDKVDPFSQMMISLPARGRYSVYQRCEQCKRKLPNVRPGKVCPICSVVHEEDRTDEDKDEFFSPMMISRHARGRYSPVYQRCEQCKRRHPNVRPEKVCPICSEVHDGIGEYTSCKEAEESLRSHKVPTKTKHSEREKEENS